MVCWAVVSEILRDNTQNEVISTRLKLHGVLFCFHVVLVSSSKFEAIPTETPFHVVIVVLAAVDVEMADGHVVLWHTEEATEVARTASEKVFYAMCQAVCQVFCHGY